MRSRTGYKREAAGACLGKNITVFFRNDEKKKVAAIKE